MTSGRHSTPAVMDTLRRVLPLLASVATAETLCTAAHAEPPQAADRSSAQQGDDTLRLDRMDRMLTSVDEAVARRSLWLAATTVTLGAADFTAGAFAAGRGAVGPAIAGFAGSALAFESGFVGLPLERAQFHRVYEGFLARRKSMDAQTTIAETERAWQTEADSAHASRIRSGVVLTTVGALVVAFSTTAVATNLGVPSKDASDTDRAAFDTALLALSGLLVVNGVAMLLEPGPVESGWQSYGLMRSPSAAPRVSFQMTPIRQGASVGMTIRF